MLRFILGFCGIWLGVSGFLVIGGLMTLRPLTYGFVMICYGVVCLANAITMKK